MLRVPSYCHQSQAFSPVATGAGAPDAVNDDYLFHQAPTGGLGKIRFHDWAVTFDRFDSPNVNVFRGQVDTFRSMLEAAVPKDSRPPTFAAVWDEASSLMDTYQLAP